MSAARAARFAGSELRMVFRRRRNVAMLVALALIPVVIGIAVKVNDAHRSGRGGDVGGIFGNITDSGVFVAFSALVVVLPLFLPMAVSVVSGEAVSGEAHTGTLRYLLAVPVGRTRLLAVKYLGVTAYAAAAAVVVAAAGALTGLVLFGTGPFTTLSGLTVSQAEGYWRLLQVAAYCAAMMLSIGAIGLFVSTLTEVPVAAMATTLALTITSEVLDAVPQLRVIHDWLPSHWWLQFGDLLREPVGYAQVVHGLLVAVAYLVVFLALAWARFSGKDVTS